MGSALESENRKKAEEWYVSIWPRAPLEEREGDIITLTALLDSVQAGCVPAHPFVGCSCYDAGKADGAKEERGKVLKAIRGFYGPWDAMAPPQQNLASIKSEWCRAIERGEHLK